MAEKHNYVIELDVNTPKASQEALKTFRSTIKESKGSINALNEAYQELARNTKDTAGLDKQYNKALKDAIKLKDKQLDKLNAEKIAVMGNKKLSEEEKKDKLETLDAQTKQLNIEKKLALASEKALKVKEKEKNLAKGLGTLVKADLIAIKDKIKAQLKFIETLKTTEGRYKALKKVAATTAKVGVKAAAGAMAIGSAAVGAAAASANAMADKDRAMASLKSGIDPSIVDEVYIKSGADYTSIVAAVNNLSSVTKDGSALVQGAVLELQNPGVGKALLSQSKMNGAAVARFDNAIAQIKKQTGVQDMSAALNAATSSRLVATGRVSQLEYLQAYAALSQAGMDDEHIARVIRNVSSRGGDFIDNLNKEDLSRYVYGQDKIRLKKQSLDLSRIDSSKESEKSSAQSTAEKLRALEIKKNEFLAKFLPVADKVLSEIAKVLDSPVADKVVNGLVDLMTKVLPLLAPVLELITDLAEAFMPVVNWLSKVATDFIGCVVVPLIKGIKGLFDDDNEDELPHVSGGARAQGGIVTAPSIVGEAGPELVLPLDYSRAGRASQIINNFNTTQSFNMHQTQATPLAFSQAIGNNRFIRRFNGV